MSVCAVGCVFQTCVSVGVPVRLFITSAMQAQMSKINANQFIAICVILSKHQIWIFEVDIRQGTAVIVDFLIYRSDASVTIFQRSASLQSSKGTLCRFW